jgi:hypothetical protein
VFLGRITLRITRWPTSRVDPTSYTTSGDVNDREPTVEVSSQSRFDLDPTGLTSLRVGGENIPTGKASLGLRGMNSTDQELPEDQKLRSLRVQIGFGRSRASYRIHGARGLSVL